MSERETSATCKSTRSGAFCAGLPQKSTEMNESFESVNLEDYTLDISECLQEYVIVERNYFSDPFPCPCMERADILTCQNCLQTRKKHRFSWIRLFFSAGQLSWFPTLPCGPLFAVALFGAASNSKSPHLLLTVPCPSPLPSRKNYIYIHISVVHLT